MCIYIHLDSLGANYLPFWGRGWEDFEKILQHPKTLKKSCSISSIMHHFSTGKKSALFIIAGHEIGKKVGVPLEIVLATINI